MGTQQQDVAFEKAKLAELKADMMASLVSYLSIPKKNVVARDSTLLKCQQSANAYFNHAEEFVGNSSLLGAHDDALWAQGFAEDCAEILLAMPGHYELMKTGFEGSESLFRLTWKPADTAFANLQRMVVRYLAKQKIKEIEKEFRKKGLPTYGFDNKAKTFMQRDKLLSFAFGTCFVIVLLAIALLKPEPSKFQYSVFRTVLSLAGAGIGAVIPGTLQVNVSNWVRAGGALAIFVAVYFWVPAQLV